MEMTIDRARSIPTADMLYEELGFENVFGIEPGQSSATPGND